METPRELIEKKAQGLMSAEKFMEGVVEEFQVLEKDLEERRFGVAARLSNMCMARQMKENIQLNLQCLGSKDGMVYYVLRRRTTSLAIGEMADGGIVLGVVKNET